MSSSATLYESQIPGYPKHRGKVRDVYDLGDKLLIVATDRLSAFDVVFQDPIPQKGYVLTQLSLWWFARTRALVPNHVLTANVDEYPAELRQYRDQLERRSMLVKKTRPFRAEFIARGYLDGSAYASYEFNKHVGSLELLAGLQRRSCFGAPIFTPSTKADEGHDRAIDYSELVHIIGDKEAVRCRTFTLALYTYAHNYVYDRGLILSDTKFEFGVDNEGEIILIDEALTPDSSRYWLKESYRPGPTPAISLDKQYLRDFVEATGWDKNPPAPRLPQEVIDQTTQRYLKAFEMVTGHPMK